MSYPEGRGREMSHAAQGAFVVVAIFFAALMFAIGVYVGQHSDPEGESGTAVVTTATGDDTETNEVPEPETETEEAETGEAETEEAETEEAETEETETSAAGEEGKLVFDTAGCGGCHTLEEAGSNANIGPNLDETGLSREEIEEKVRVGGGGMPPFEGQLSDDEIGAVAEFVAASAG